MKTMRFILGSVALLALCASTSLAQGQRTFVSGLGNDNNPCSRTAPCRSFSQALVQTAAGGEVVVLDSASYGAFTINFSVSIIAPPGLYAGISVFAGNGINISAGSSDTVILRGLAVSSQGGTNGIVFTSGGTLHIEDCVVNGFSNNGAGVAFNGAGNLEVKDSIIRGNFNGIVVQPSSGTAFAVIDQVRLEMNANNGLTAREGSNVVVRNSIASGNSYGFVALSKSSVGADLTIENCVASNHPQSGIFAESDSTGVATVLVSNSTMTNNGFDLQACCFPAVILSRGNNTEVSLFNGGFIGSYSPN